MVAAELLDWASGAGPPWDSGGGQCPSQAMGFLDSAIGVLLDADKKVRFGLMFLTPRLTDLCFPAARRDHAISHHHKRPSVE